MGRPDYSVSTVTGYLRRPFHAAETEAINDTVVFHARRRVFSSSDLMARAVQVARERKSPVVVVQVSLYYLPNPPAGFKCERLFTSQISTLRDKVFDGYRLEAN